MTTANLLLNDVHRSLYRAVVRDVYDELLAAQRVSEERQATPEQERALQTAVELFERLGLAL